MGVFRSTRRFIASHRRVLLVVMCCALPLLGAFVATELYRTIDYRERFVELRGELTEVEESLEGTRDGHDLIAIRLANERGIVVRGYLKVPRHEEDANETFPVLILLGGLRTGRHTIDYVDNTRGVILLALDYPYEGKKERFGVGEFIRAIPRIRDAIIRTVPAAMMSVDYLLTRNDVDAERIVVVGGSVGALFTPAVAATDTRIAGAAMLFGAGDTQRLMRANLKMPGWLARPASWLGSILVSPVEPTKYVGDISPRPVFMLNGRGDPRMPERCSRLLHEAAREPKRVRWIDAGHVEIRSEEFHDLVSRELADWLVERDLIAPDCLILRD